MTGLWGGRFRGKMAPEMEALNRSLDTDGRLWREDIRGSRAWARGLMRAGVLTSVEHDSLAKGLDRVEKDLSQGIPTGAVDEDIHTLVERLLADAVGEVAGKLHTGRSRNDQVSTDMRLWGMEATARLDGLVSDAIQAVAALADKGIDLILPGYTHVQQAQPVRAAHWALSHAWPLLRDRDRIRSAGQSAGVLPLGSGALAGCPFPVDREALRVELGFHSISENSMDAVSDRDWSAELIFAGALLGVHLSRLSEDLVLFASREFGFVRIGDEHSTGSSLMPQKRNPDVAELVRGKSGRLAGNLTGIITLLKGLPSGYNRDLQEEKSFLFDTVDTLALALPAIRGAISGASFRPDRISAALDPELLATDLADHLVRAGVPFRKSHEILGGLVREAEERGLSLAALPDDVFAQAHPSFAKGFRQALDWERSVEARDVPGGTSRRAVKAQLEAIRARL